MEDLARLAARRGRPFRWPPMAGIPRFARAEQEGGGAIIVLNGYPGVGKLTIGRALVDLIAGRLLDIHSIYNVAFALTEFRSPQFVATWVRAV